jgi:hypothetical protein
MKLMTSKNADLPLEFGPTRTWNGRRGFVHALQAAEISRFDSGNQLMPSSILYKLARQGRLSYFDSMRMA